jgi:hypothetical protein
MHLRFSCLTVLLFAGSAVAQTPTIPDHPIAEKKELLFSDDFEGSTPKKEWHKVVPTFAFENGTLKGTQTRDKNIPAVDGKPAVSAHAAVFGLDVPTKDSVVEVKIKLDGASMVDVEFDDRKYTGAHYGHLCRAQVRLDSVKLVDERDGGMKNDIYEMRTDPTKKAEITKLLVGRARPSRPSSRRGSGTRWSSRRSATRCASRSTADRRDI